MGASMAATSRYADTPMSVQTARCCLALDLFERSLSRFTRATFAGDARAQAQLARVTRWCDEVMLQYAPGHISPAGKLAIGRAQKKFEALAVMCGLSAEAKAKRKVALLWGTLLLVDDCRVTCPALARTRAWYYLSRTADTLARALLDLFPGADVDGDGYYMQLAWKAE